MDFSLMGETSLLEKAIATAGTQLAKELSELKEHQTVLGYVPEDKKAQVIEEGTVIGDFIESLKSKIGSTELGANPKLLDRYTHIIANMILNTKRGDNKSNVELARLHQTRGENAASLTAEKNVAAAIKASANPQAMEQQLAAIKAVIRGKAAGDFTPDKLKAFLDKQVKTAQAGMGGSTTK